MKRAVLSRKGQQGSIAIMALVVCMLGTIGITAWMSLFNARVNSIDAMDMAIDRRISIQNSKAAAKEYVYRNVVTEATIPTVSPAVEETDEWFRYSVPTPGSWAQSPLASPTFELTNQFTLASGTANTQNLTVRVSDVADVADTRAVDYTVQVRTLTTPLGGVLFSLHTPTIDAGQTNLVGGNLNIFGRSVIYTGEPDANMGTLASLEYVSPPVATPTLELKAPGAPSGPSVLPTNYPLPPMTNNKHLGAIAYNGILNIIRPGPGNEENSLYQQAMAKGPVSVNGAAASGPDRGVESDGTDDITVQLDNGVLEAVYIENTERVWLQGQVLPLQFNDAGVLPPLIIVINQKPLQTDLTSIFLMGTNNRRLIVAVKKDDIGGGEVGVIFWNSNDNPPWRLQLVAENTRTRLQNAFGGTVLVTGGIRTDRSVIQENIGLPGRIDVVEELDPGTLPDLEARNAWLEIYRQ